MSIASWADRVKFAAQDFQRDGMGAYDQRRPLCEGDVLAVERSLIELEASLCGARLAVRELRRDFERGRRAAAAS